MFIRTSIFALLLLASVAFAGEVTKNYNYKDFHEVRVGYGMIVDISQSDTYSIQVIADDKDLQHLKVVKTGDEIEFYFDKKNYRKKDEINIKITMPFLTGLDLNGGSIGKISMEVPTKNMNCDLSGGAILKGSLKCSDIVLDLSGGSQITLNGSSKNVELDGSGGAIFHLKDFSVKDAEVSLSGGSRVSINMNGRLNASQSGGSQITYYGKADIGSTSFSGGSSIKKGD